MPDTRTIIEEEVDDARQALDTLREQFVSSARWLAADLEVAARAAERGEPVNSLGICQSKSQTVDRLAALIDAATNRLEAARRLAKSAQVVA